MVAMFVGHENCRQIGRIDALGHEELLECGKSYPGFKEEDGRVGAKKIRIAGAAARERAKEEQDWAFRLVRCR